MSTAPADWWPDPADDVMPPTRAGYGDAMDVLATDVKVFRHKRTMVEEVDHGRPTASATSRHTTRRRPTTLCQFPDRPRSGCREDRGLGPERRHEDD